MNPSVRHDSSKTSESVSQFICEKKSYSLRFKKSLIVSLILFILCFSLSKKFSDRSPKTPVFPVYYVFDVSDIPMTSHGSKRAPSRPVIPIPDESEYLQDDEPIDFDVWEDAPFWGGIGSDLGSVRIYARPIFEVLPDYPEELQQKDVRGMIELSVLINSEGNVDSVKVVRNTTGSALLRRSAVEAAFKCRYLPAAKNKPRPDVWSRRIYQFGME